MDDGPMDNDLRDPQEEDSEGRMTDLLPEPDEDFDDEAVATETEDDYDDESDAEVPLEGEMPITQTVEGVGTVYGAGGYRPE